TLVPVEPLDGIKGTYLSMISLNNRLALAYLTFSELFTTVADLSIAVSNTATPAALTDWTRIRLAGADQAGAETHIGDLNGKIAVSYQSFPAGLFFARATTATPSSPADFVVTQADFADRSGWGTAWVTYHGAPAIVHRGWYDGSVMLARSTVAEPSDSGEWQTTVVWQGSLGPFDANNFAANCGLAVDDDRLVAAFTDLTTKDLTIASALTADPLGPQSWQSYVIAPVSDPSNQVVGDLDLKVIDGRLILPYHVDLNPVAFDARGGLRAARALIPHPTSAAGWAIGEVDTAEPGREGGHLPSITAYNNRLWVAYLANGPSGWTLGLWVASSDNSW
ncbi:MAG: hypothetical protein ABI743_09980, partial [bacterium]